MEEPKIKLIKEEANKKVFSLPFDWTKEVRYRKMSPESKGPKRLCDVYLFSPVGQMLRSNPELLKFLDENPEIPYDPEVTTLKRFSDDITPKKPLKKPAKIKKRKLSEKENESSALPGKKVKRSPKRQIPCTKCAKWFRYEKTFQNHQCIEVQLEFPYENFGTDFICHFQIDGIICNAKFGKIKDLKNHQSIHKVPDRKAVMTKPYQCGNCSEKYAQITELTSHVAQETCQSDSDSEEDSKFAQISLSHSEGEATLVLASNLSFCGDSSEQLSTDEEKIELKMAKNEQKGEGNEQKGEENEQKGEENEHRLEENEQMREVDEDNFEQISDDFQQNISKDLLTDAKTPKSRNSSAYETLKRNKDIDIVKIEEDCSGKNVERLPDQKTIEEMENLSKEPEKKRKFDGKFGRNKKRSTTNLDCESSPILNSKVPRNKRKLKIESDEVSSETSEVLQLNPVERSEKLNSEPREFNGEVEKTEVPIQPETDVEISKTKLPDQKIIVKPKNLTKEPEMEVPVKNKANRQSQHNESLSSVLSDDGALVNAEKAEKEPDSCVPEKKKAKRGRKPKAKVKEELDKESKLESTVLPDESSIIKVENCERKPDLSLSEKKKGKRGRKPKVKIEQETDEAVKWEVLVLPTVKADFGERKPDLCSSEKKESKRGRKTKAKIEQETDETIKVDSAVLPDDVHIIKSENSEKEPDFSLSEKKTPKRGRKPKVKTEDQNITNSKVLPDKKAGVRPKASEKEPGDKVSESKRSKRQPKPKIRNDMLSEKELEDEINSREAVKDENSPNIGQETDEKVPKSKLMKVREESGNSENENSSSAKKAKGRPKSEKLAKIKILDDNPSEISKTEHLPIDNDNIKKAPKRGRPSLNSTKKSNDIITNTKSPKIQPEVKKPRRKSIKTPKSSHNSEPCIQKIDDNLTELSDPDLPNTSTDLPKTPEFSLKRPEYTDESQIAKNPFRNPVVKIRGETFTLTFDITDSDESESSNNEEKSPKKPCIYDCLYLKPNGKICQEWFDFGPVYIKHQRDHQNDLPCQCYKCQDSSVPKDNFEFVCDYVFQDNNVACGHRDNSLIGLTVHKERMGHNVFRKGCKIFQCDQCRLIFNYETHFAGHPCVERPL